MSSKRLSRRTALPAIVFALALAGCTAPRSPAMSLSEERSSVPDAVPSSKMEQGKLAFGIDLYRRLGADGGNIVFSPVSITAAFGLVQPGARGETAEQIRRVLRLRSDSDQTAMLTALPLDQPGRRVTIGNAVWLQQGYPLKPDYRRIVTDRSGAPPRPLDFRNAQAAAAAINRWVEIGTAGKIKRLVDPTSIEPDTRLVLTNTVYLKADWTRPFDRSDTQSGAFRLASGQSVTVPFMSQIVPHRLLETNSFQAVELAYQGDELAMILFLPRAPDGLAAFERELTATKLEKWIKELRATESRSVNVNIPKLELATRYELPETLQRMGMVLAFSNQADLSGITDAERLKIDNVTHQATLAVDELGTEASAATAIQIRPVSAPPPGVLFRADHPFFMAIRDNRSGTLLFMGRIADPSAR